MKKYSFLLKIMVGMSLVFGASSCLKDDAHYTDFASVSPIADFPQSANVGIVDNEAFLLSNTPSTYSFDVKVESVNPTTASTDVTIDIDKNYLSNYNAGLLAADSTNQLLEVLPDSTYTLSSKTVTIPAGKTIGTFTLSIKTTKIDVNHSYALPYTIKSATNGVTPSANYGTKFIIFGIKNQYAGDYRSVGFFQHPTAPRKIDRDKTLSTINATTSQTEYADLGTAVMQLQVNPDNSVTIIIPVGSSANAATVQTAGKYDPVAKAFTLGYYYVGASGKRVINEVITLK